VSDAELARRAAAFTPTWANYQEDIKAGLGAAPAAEWQGEAFAAWATDGGIVIRFRIDGPWAARDAAAPVLVRMPAGEVEVARTARPWAGGMDYLVDTPGGDAPPWVEARYPHGESRLEVADSPPEAAD
jgi:hypothetical protein